MFYNYNIMLLLTTKQIFMYIISLMMLYNGDG